MIQNINLCNRDNIYRFDTNDERCSFVKEYCGNDVNAFNITQFYFCDLKESWIISGMMFVKFYLNKEARNCSPI